MRARLVDVTEGEQPLPLPTSNEFALGQSLQIRVGPDAESNSSLLDFRWSVNQLTVQGPGEGPQEVPVPDRGDLIRSLLESHYDFLWITGEVVPAVTGTTHRRLAPHRDGADSITAVPAITGARKCGRFLHICHQITGR